MKRKTFAIVAATTIAIFTASASFAGPGVGGTGTGSSIYTTLLALFGL